MKLLNWIKSHKILLLIVLIGAIFRFYKLDYQDIWIDEIFTLIQSSPSKTYMGIYDFLKTYDQHPPLYYFSTHFFSQLFGQSVFVVRMFSALVGVAGIFAIYAIGKELMNKKVGLFAAAVLCINYFHIYYSQEARMYSMLFLATTLSFYFLIKFIKSANLKNAVIYAFFASVMIYSHFFALFTLFSQYLILLYFVIKPFQIERKKFFFFSLISGIITLLLYIPALYILLQNIKITSIWIQIPTSDFFIQTVKEFFGNAEIVLFFVTSLIVLFFWKLYQQKSTIGFTINPNEEKLVFTFFVLSIWILITFIIPLIYSFINLPMLVNRYLINILPAIIIIVAIGLYYVKNNIIQISVLSFIVVFSITDLLIVKDYYKKVTKSEFTILTDEIKKRNPNNSKVVTYWSWLIPYFFDETTRIRVENGTLDEYVNDLKQRTVTSNPFWYADGNSRPLSISPENQEFLNKNYILKEKLEYFDVWANYYVPLNSTTVKNTLNLDMFNNATIDGSGSLVLFENATLSTNKILIEKGNYSLFISGQSLPEKPINNENAHIIIKQNNKEIANFYLNESTKAQPKVFDFNANNDEETIFQIIFDNDIFAEGLDRNAIIKSISIKKIIIKNIIK